MPEIMKYFAGVDPGVMASIGVIALLCRRMPRVGSPVLAALVSFALGMLWGWVENSAEAVPLPTAVRGIFLNSAGAVIAARLVEQGLVKAGLVKPMNGNGAPPPPEPPKEAA